MINYDNLKKDTYLFLISNNEKAKKLILSSLLISLCHDSCLKDKKNLVSPGFIKNCCLLVPFEMNYEKMNTISEEEKFSLIRNKLAHGDFVYNNVTEEIYIKHTINNENVLTSIKLDNIIKFAKEITNYYDYLNNDYKRQKIVIYQGYKMTFIENNTPFKNRSKNSSERFDFIVNNVKRKLPYIILHHNPNRKKYNYREIMCPLRKSDRNISSDKIMNVDIYIEKTNQEDTVIDRPDINPLIKELELLLNDSKCNNNYQNIFDLLCKFYVIFIYPLENFLKNNDTNVYSLNDNKMFNFSLLDINSVDDKDTINVGKTSSYSDDLIRCYEKIGMLYERKNKLNKCRTNNININTKLQEIENAINELIDLLNNDSIKTIYNYSKNRSIIEHLRCSIMHGNYYYNEEENTLTFKDIWKHKELYNKTLTLKEFRNLFNIENTSLISEQFEEVYTKKKNNV